MPLPYPYPYDSLGTAGTNRIVNEVRVITPPTDPELANWIMPAAAPFHSDSVIMRLGPLPTDTTLTFGVDYVFTHYFVSLSQHIAKPIYGSIKFLNRNFSGSIYLTYQTVGGPFTVADTLILENLSRSLYNISTVTWDQIQGVPQFFPPAPHQHDVADMTGMADVVTALNSLVTAITGQNGNIAGIVTTLQQHIASLSAHTPAAVGLGNVPNFAVATLQDVLDAVSNKLMTPERTLQQVTLLTAGLATAAQVAAETIARQNADTALQQAIDNEATARQNADTLATQALATESTSRQNADASLHSEVVTETNARVAGDQHLQDQIDSLSGAAGGFASQTDLNNEITNRQSAVSAEATARANADTTLQNNIDSEATARANADTDLQNQINAITGSSGSFATTAQLTAEATARQNADQGLAQGISDLVSSLAQEGIDRAFGDLGLQNQINALHGVPQPSASDLILTSTGTTPTSFAWRSVDTVRNLKLEAADLHDGFKLVWKNNNLRLMPKNGGLIWINGNLYQIPTNGITYAPMSINSSWVTTVNANNWRGRSMWVVVKEDGVGGIALDLAGDSFTFPTTPYAIRDPYSSHYVEHPVTKTLSIFQGGVGGGYRYDLTCVGAIKLAFNNGYYPGYSSFGPVSPSPKGNFVHSMDSRGTMEASLRTYSSFYRYGKIRNSSGNYVVGPIFKQDSPTQTKRYVPDPAMNSNIPDISGDFTRYFDGSTISSLLGCASGFGGDFNVEYDFSIQMTSGSGDERIWAGVAEGDDFIFTAEEYPDNPGDWPNPPSYIDSDGINLPFGFSWTPLINAWNVGNSAHGRCVVNANGQPYCSLVNIFLFADNAAQGAPISDIRLMHANVRMWRDNIIWRHDLW